MANVVSIDTEITLIDVNGIQESNVEEIRHRAAIAGYVTDAITRQGIWGAIVEIVGQNLRTQTRNDGFFYFRDLPTGQYSLNLAASHLGSRYGIATVLNVMVQNAADGRPIFDPKANIPLPPTRLTGQVKRSDNNQAIATAIIQVLGSEAQILTDKNRLFSLSGIQAGKPTIKVSAKGFVTATQQVIMTA
ncbi:MAG TPA: carboxypeptidase regulatory-like domain-containing protein [Waterburya sp.]